MKLSGAGVSMHYLDADGASHDTIPHGTSFSAAHLSVMEARYMLTGGTTGQCNANVVPALGYSHPGAPMWLNMPMDAADTYCQFFDRHAARPSLSPSTSPSP